MSNNSIGFYGIPYDKYQVIVNNKLFSNGKIYEIKTKKTTSSELVTTYLSDAIKNAGVNINYSQTSFERVCSQSDNCNWNIDYNWCPFKK